VVERRRWKQAVGGGRIPQSSGEANPGELLQEMRPRVVTLVLLVEVLLLALDVLLVLAGAVFGQGRLVPEPGQAA
jgi:hypothetical protein